MKGPVPPEITARKEHGFGVPLGRWFRIDLKNYVREVVLSARYIDRGYFKEKFLRRLIDEHFDGNCDHGHRLWTSLTFEIWHRIFTNLEIIS
jgi:asparagine synthase (glutamine-hydrolysing)